MSQLQDFFFKRHLDDEEHIQAVVHKYWMTGIKNLFWPTALFIGLWVLLYYMRDRYVLYATAILSVATLIWWIRNFLDYYLDAWLITNKGIIDLEWHGWFHRQSARVLYSDIDAVSYEINGVFSTLFNLGLVTVEKISTGSAISMPYVKGPRKVESMILECMETYMHKKNLKDAKTVQNILAEFVAGSIQSEQFEATDGDEAEIE